MLQTCLAFSRVHLQPDLQGGLPLEHQHIAHSKLQAPGQVQRAPAPKNKSGLGACWCWLEAGCIARLSRLQPLHGLQQGAWHYESSRSCDSTHA